MTRHTSVLGYVSGPMEWKPLLSSTAGGDKFNFQVLCQAPSNLRSQHNRNALVGVAEPGEVYSSMRRSSMVCLIEAC